MGERFTKLNGRSAVRASAVFWSSLSLVAVLAACSTAPSENDKPAESAQAPAQPTLAPPPEPSPGAARESDRNADADVQVVKVPLLDAPQGKKMQEGAQEDAPEQSAPAVAPSVVATPAVSPAVSAPAVVPVSKDPKTFVVTVGHKDKSHLAFGAGHEMGFVVNGVQGRDLVLVRGAEYTFQVRTDPKHDFYLSTKPFGGGGAAFTEGVTGQFIYDGEVVFKPSEKSPDLLYYQCRNHQNMGGRIAIVNSTAEVMAAEDSLAKDRAAAIANRSVQAKSDSVTELKAQQKIAYAEMLLKIKAGGLPEDRKKVVGDRIVAAKQVKDKGDFARAYALAGEAADILSGKQPLAAGPTDEELAEQEKVYSERLSGLQALQKSHADAYKRAQKSGKKGAAVDYDRNEVDRLLAQAHDLAKGKRYEDAAKLLSKGELAVAKALNDMLSSQTLVYELTFDTPKDEYEYEVARFRSYDELVPVAVDVKKPSPQAMALMKGYVTKSHFFRDKAGESAAAGRFDEAIAIMRDATAEVRRGLMALGVSM